MLDQQKLAEDHVYGEVLEEQVYNDARKFANWLHKEGLIESPRKMTREQIIDQYLMSDDSEVL